VTDINWGPSGQTVYERTYSRTKPNGEKEVWEDTINRVAHGNLALVHGDDEMEWPIEACNEYVELTHAMRNFRILPAGRHLWASGVKGRQYLMNCWTAGWSDRFSEHFEFTFLRLMEGGGVGANYSSRFLAGYGAPRRELDVHIVCDPAHPDYQDMLDAGHLSEEYDSEWDGAFEVEDSREGWASALVDLLDTFMDDGTVLHRGRVFDVSRVRPSGSRLKTFGGTASGPTPFAAMMHEVCRVMNEASVNAVPRRVVMGLDPAGDWQDVGYTTQPIIVHHTTGVETTTIDPIGHLTPMQAMEIDHAIAECVVSGGNRRSARMSIVRWDDPFIHEFINCKADSGKHWTTNISVEVDEAFFLDLDPRNEGRKEIPFPARGEAKHVHEAVVAGMLANGEPGYWNSSLSNHGELVPVYATNPCGEITLQMWEACNLGHVNLDAFAPKSTSEHWDEGGLLRAHELVTRFLIRATYADINDPNSREVQDRNRRIGVGHLGVQGFLVKNGWRYSDVAINGRSPGHGHFRQLLNRMYRTVRAAAREYAFELRIPEPIKVTTVAPTGSVAKLPGVTEGIHPIYARFFERRIRFSMVDDAQVETIEKAKAEGLEVEIDMYDRSGNTSIIVYPTKDPLVAQVEAMGYDRDIVESASEIPLGSMLAFQAMYQEHWADNAVSFTVNVKPGLDPQVAGDIIRHWLPKVKGTTIMVDESRPQSPYTAITEEEYESAKVKQIEDSIDLDCATGACPIR
jgi:ribonucleoside-triphosphate reductase